jgi:hypothetical protein
MPRSYCTEDTPVCMSHSGSNTNLSALSLMDEDDQEDQDDAEFLMQVIRDGESMKNKSVSICQLSILRIRFTLPFC